MRLLLGTHFMQATGEVTANAGKRDSISGLSRMTDTKLCLLLKESWVETETVYML